MTWRRTRAAARAPHEEVSSNVRNISAARPVIPKNWPASLQSILDGTVTPAPFMKRPHSTHISASSGSTVSENTSNKYLGIDSLNRGLCSVIYFLNDLVLKYYHTTTYVGVMWIEFGVQKERAITETWLLDSLVCSVRHALFLCTPTSKARNSHITDWIIKMYKKDPSSSNILFPRLSVPARDFDRPTVGARSRPSSSGFPREVHAVRAADPSLPSERHREGHVGPRHWLQKEGKRQFLRVCHYCCSARNLW